eukprot:TRINITY_DN4246_c0_g1_i1.p1 TRINITY_DN4246_c0_g1~~TRINITY_DN4246_c0_g1_i1.p1  ORF type:complete len:335 (-),score=117.74 TRINITY_DN4246_c0_g1_i1:54-1058(-)
MTTSKRGNANRRREYRHPREESDSNSENEEKSGKSELSLYEACEKGIFPVVDRLLKEGMSPNGPNQAKWLPIHGAAISGHTDIVERLLKEPSVDINARNPFNETALTLASCWGHIDTVRLLLNKGADVTLKDWQNRDALAFAKSMFGKSKMVELIDLLEDAIKKTSNSQSKDSALPSNNNAKTEPVKTASNESFNNSAKAEPVKTTFTAPSNPVFNFGTPTASIPHVPSKPSNNNNNNNSNSQAKIPPRNPPPSKPSPPSTSSQSTTPNSNNNNSTTEKKIHSCARCGKNKVFKKCGACKATYYCDQRCQEEDWPTHSKHCKSFAIALAAQNEN